MKTSSASITAADLAGALSQMAGGQPPSNPAILRQVTVGSPLWLEGMRERLLAGFVAQGGSKLKWFLGGSGEGKSHALGLLRAEAEECGYEVITLSLRQQPRCLSSFANLVGCVVQQMDRERFAQGLSFAVALELGLSVPGGRERWTQELLDRHANDGAAAMKAIMVACTQVLQRLELPNSFWFFVWQLVTSRFLGGREQQEAIAFRWLQGERLSAAERREVRLYDSLGARTGRLWLNSLCQLLKCSGRAGLFVSVDDLSAVALKDGNGGNFLTPSQVKDTWELLRQLIDDTEWLSHFFMALGVDAALMDPCEKRGLTSYEALWMRLQSGFRAADMRFNPMADLVDLAAMRREFGADWHTELRRRVVALAQAADFALPHAAELPSLAPRALLLPWLNQLAPSLEEQGKGGVL